MVPLARLPRLIDQGHLQALAVTASSYTTGEHVTFFEAGERLDPWVRSQRRAVRDCITHAHLLASSAIPFVFPATGIAVDGRTEYFGDGSMRQSAPMAAPIHLGAERILVVGAGRMHEPRAEPGDPRPPGYPTLAQIAGHALSNIFLDALSVDVERMQRINHTLSLIPQASRSGSALRPIELLVIAPSQQMDAMAARHVADLPAPVRTLLGAPGRVGRPAGRERRGACQLPAVRVGLHARAHGPGPRRHAGPARPGVPLPGLDRPRRAAAHGTRRLSAPRAAPQRLKLPVPPDGAPRHESRTFMPERKLFVTTALPYANGNFHIGHIMEYIQADIWVRFQRMQGHAVNFVGADDTHGAPIMIAAEKAGQTPQQFVAGIAAGRQQYLDGFHIGFDNWHSTDGPENHELARQIYRDLRDIPADRAAR